MQLIFCMQISMKACFKLILWFWWRCSSIPKVPKIASLQCLQYLKKEVRDEVDFLHADKHQSFLQVDFNTLGIKDFYKVILSLLMGMIQHSQSTQTTSLQYLYNIWEKKLGTIKLTLSFLMKVARHVKSIQNRKLVKFLQYKFFPILSRVPGMFIVTCFWVVVVKNGCGLLGNSKIFYISRMIWWNELIFCMLIQIWESSMLIL